MLRKFLNKKKYFEREKEDEKSFYCQMLLKMKKKVKFL